MSNHNTQIVSVINGQPFTTSLTIAEGIGREHASVIKLVRTYLDDLEEFGRVGIKIQTFPTNGGIQEREYAVLNEPQATLFLTFMRNSDVVRQFKKSLTKAFWDMAKQLSQPAAAPGVVVAETKALAALEAHLKASTLLSCPLHIGQTEAVKLVREAYAVDFGPLLLHAPAQNNIHQQEVMLEPTELGRKFGMTAKQVNLLLEETGLQIKTEAGWEPTKTGAALCTKHHWVKGHKSGYNLKWYVDQLQALFSVHH